MNTKPKVYREEDGALVFEGGRGDNSQRFVVAPSDVEDFAKKVLAAHNAATQEEWIAGL